MNEKPVETSASDAAPIDAAPIDAAPIDDMKRKFREALDRKNKKHLENPAGNVDGESSVVGAQSKIGGKREFRRKSGG
ncbi:MAG: DUF5302 domain-containing protein [Pseudolysinimonas sp.]|uniref:DUF5302 domain-containing protein n=1 Tax=Pseudolysinimonas sp. TaxID=2680009 RepID=UPI0032668338